VCVSKRRWCRRVDGYIWLRNVGKMELRVVRHLELEWCSVDRLVCDWWRVAKRRWCRRVDWYIWLRNVGKMERRVVRYLELEWCSVDRVVCVCVGLVTSEEWRNASGGNMEESYSSREPLGPGKRPKKFLKFFLVENDYMRCVMRILTWWAGAAVEFGILSCAILVKSSSRMLLGLCYFEKWVYRCRTEWCMW